MDAIVLHGGASARPELNERVKKYAEQAFDMKNALDAVVEAVRLMEDDPLFNAGTGSNVRIDGSIQMDAAVMVPNDFGGVINIEYVKNPILVARDVLKKSPHLILAGAGATEFARKMGYEEYNPITQRAVAKRDKTIEKLKKGEIPSYYHPEFFADFLGDTVGAVAYINGEFAAAVSTGGTSLTLHGRVGDSPIPGAGIYCGSNGAVVSTGIGEEIIRRMSAMSIYSKIGTSDLYAICDAEIEKYENIPVGFIAISKDEQCAKSNLMMPNAVLTR